MVEQKVEIAIVGAGVIGLCSAYYLEKQGFQVHLFDKGQPYEACSSENAGLVVPSHVEPLANPGVLSQGLGMLLKKDSPFRIKPQLSLDLMRWLLAFRKASNATVVEKNSEVLHHLLQNSRHLFDELSSDLEFPLEKRGLLMVYRSQKGEKSLDSLCDLASSTHLPFEKWDQKLLFENEPAAPKASTGGIFFPTDAHLDPQLFLASLSQHLKSKGVVFHNYTVVNNIESNGKLMTDKGVFKADKVLLTSGAWTPRIAKTLGARLPIQPGKGYTLTLDLGPKKPKIPMILSEEKVSLTPFDKKIRFGGTLELAAFDDQITKSRAKNIFDVASEYHTSEVARETWAEKLWSGLRPCTPDGLPILGYLDSNQQIAVASGHAMLGISLGPVSGKLIAEMIKGQNTSLPLQALAPSRF